MQAVISSSPVSQLLDLMEVLIRNGPGVEWADVPEWADGEACPEDHLWEAGMTLHRGDVASEIEHAGIVLWNDGDPKDHVEDRTGLIWEIPLACKVLYGRSMPSAEAESMRAALFTLFCADLHKDDPEAESKALDRLTGAGVKAIRITDADCSKYEDLRNKTVLDFTFTVRCIRLAEEAP